MPLVLISIGLILIFVIQVLIYLASLSGVTFMVEGETVSYPPINLLMYIIPGVFILGGVLMMFFGKLK
jgi:hypothetical protein